MSALLTRITRQVSRTFGLKYEMQQPGTQDDRKHVHCISGKNSKFSSDLGVHNLRGRVVRRDIKHIRVSIRMRGNIDDGCDDTSDRKYSCRLPKSFGGWQHHAGKGDEQSDEDQKDMPDKSMQGQRPVRVHQTGRIDEHHDGTEQVVIIHKSAKNTLIFMRNKGQQQAEVHRQAAELEWKIPPVVVPVVFYVIEKKLFVDLGKCQKNTAGKEQMQTERFGARPQFPGGKGGERDADQHKC